MEIFFRAARLKTPLLWRRYTLINPRRAFREGYSSCLVCLSVCLSVCLYVRTYAILAVRAVRSLTKDAIVLSVRFAAILKRRFS